MKNVNENDVEMEDLSDALLPIKKGISNDIAEASIDKEPVSNSKEKISN